MAVDKPAGISVHNLPGGDLSTLLERFIQEYSAGRDLLEMETGFGLHAVHRLDQDTSGVVLLAARRETFRFLSEQFSGGQVSKLYLAVLHGRLPMFSDPDGWQRWEWPLTPRAAGRSNPRGSGERRPATTLFRMLRYQARYSLIQCRPITGRTHQIRRHAVLAGHGIVGDRRYGSMRAVRYLQQHLNFSRLALHAAELTFRPSAGKEPVCVKSRGLPPELDQLMERGREDDHPSQH
jgi:RluA family pseudouridine synthase